MKREKNRGQRSHTHSWREEKNGRQRKERHVWFDHVISFKFDCVGAYGRIGECAMERYWWPNQWYTCSPPLMRMPVACAHVSPMHGCMRKRQRCKYDEWLSKSQHMTSHHIYTNNNRNIDVYKCTYIQIAMIQRSAISIRTCVFNPMSSIARAHAHSHNATEDDRSGMESKRQQHAPKCFRSHFALAKCAHSHGRWTAIANLRWLKKFTFTRRTAATRS